MALNIDPPPVRLFSKNNHSQWRVAYNPVDPTTTTDISAVMKSHFSYYVDELHQVQQVAAAEINNQNFQIKGLKDGQEKRFLIRRIGEDADTRTVLPRLQIGKRLRARGCALPEALAANSGDLVVEYADRRYVLFEFVEGHHFRGTLRELEDAGREIGKLDRSLELLTPEYTKSGAFGFSPKYEKARTFSPEGWGEVFDRISTLLKNGVDSAFAIRALRCRNIILETTYYVIRDLRKFALQISHIDLHPHNLLSDGQNIKLILDLDALYLTEKLRALAFAVHRLVRQTIIYSRRKASPDAVRRGTRQFINGYRTQNHISHSEVAMIPCFIADEALRRLSVILKSYACTGHSPWKSDLEKQFATLYEAKLFDFDI